MAAPISFPIDKDGNRILKEVLDAGLLEFNRDINLIIILENLFVSENYFRFFQYGGPRGRLSRRPA